MARVDLTINAFARAGITDPTGQSVIAANDAMFQNDGRTVLRIANASGFSANLSMETPGTADGVLAIADLVPAAQANATTFWYGPFETGLFNQTSGADAGKVYVNTDQTVTITAFRLP